MKKINFIICFLAFFSPVFGQNLSGIWEGTITKRGNKEPYLMRMEVIQTGQKINAITTISYADNDTIVCEKITIGELKEDRRGNNLKGILLAYQDTAFISHRHFRAAYWLLGLGELNYDINDDILSGKVDAYDWYFQKVRKNYDEVYLTRGKVPNLTDKNKIKDKVNKHKKNNQKKVLPYEPYKKEG